MCRKTEIFFKVVRTDFGAVKPSFLLSFLSASSRTTGHKVGLAVCSCR